MPDSAALLSEAGARTRPASAGIGLESVSPRMLYNFARRYDEYAGEDYEGSSCRGALKAFFKHGVCLNGDWFGTQTTWVSVRYRHLMRHFAYEFVQLCCPDTDIRQLQQQTA